MARIAARRVGGGQTSLEIGLILRTYRLIYQVQRVKDWLCSILQGTSVCSADIAGWFILMMEDGFGTRHDTAGRRKTQLTIGHGFCNSELKKMTQKP
ncbi:hypothetical protein TNIN_120701 [Trichonephila inaurata madagascariensis]|uniref:Uncharacterized protein n=1 Tax=Trichonephila inaurata madagascariensis TaxID=2747483 RepID=A0A8X6YCV1_9ARAC|nr:hypothetical protein TNIN_120701 [Trichonephila inaurata madagascariensis]